MTLLCIRSGSYWVRKHNYAAVRNAGRSLQQFSRYEGLLRGARQAEFQAEDFQASSNASLSSR